jgi:Peptidase_C39 like family
MNALIPLLLAALPSVQIDGLPFVQQKPDFCGEADVEMALRRLGRNVTQDDVFNASSLDPLKGRGVWADDLGDSMRALGLDPGQTWYRVNPAKAASEVDAQFAALHADLVAGTPSIVCMHYDASPGTTEHFRLITGYDSTKDEVVYQEPAEPNGANRRICYWLQERGLLVKFVARAQALKATDSTGLTALTEVLGGDPDSFQKDWEKFVAGLKRARRS